MQDLFLVNLLRDPLDPSPSVFDLSTLLYNKYHISEDGLSQLHQQHYYQKAMLLGSFCVHSRCSLERDPVHYG